MKWVYRSVYRTLISLVAIASLTSGGCGSGEDNVSGAELEDDAGVEDSEESSYLSWPEELAASLVAETTADLLPPPLEPELIDIFETKLHRQQVADGMRVAVAAAMVPLVIAAAFFAVEGPADLVLTIVPVQWLGDAAKVAGRAYKARNGKRAAELVTHLDEFEAALDPRAREISRLALHLTRSQRKAVRTLHDRGVPTDVINLLMRKQLAHEVDIVWLAKVMDRGKLDAADVRRFSFDADLVSEYTEHSAGLSWKTLEDIAKRRPVSDGAREAMASKVKGLLGERAAAAMVQNKLFAKKYLGNNGGSFSAARGIAYRRYGTSGSLDVVAFGSGLKMLFAEVKHWSPERWANASHREALFEQLGRHDIGVEEIMRRHSLHTMTAKVLMVSEKGFLGGLTGRAQDRFRQDLTDRGWRFELIPDDGIASFADLINAAR